MRPDSATEAQCARSPRRTFMTARRAPLWDVLDHYNKSDAIPNAYLDEDIQPLALNQVEIDDVVALLAMRPVRSTKEQGMRELERRRTLTHRPSVA